MRFSKISNPINHPLKIRLLCYSSSVFCSLPPSPCPFQEPSLCWDPSSSVSGCKTANKLLTRALIANVSMTLHQRSWIKMFSGKVGNSLIPERTINHSKNPSTYILKSPWFSEQRPSLKHTSSDWGSVLRKCCWGLQYSSHKSRWVKLCSYSRKDGINIKNGSWFVSPVQLLHHLAWRAAPALVMDSSTSSRLLGTQLSLVTSPFSPAAVQQLSLLPDH